MALASDIRLFDSALGDRVRGYISEIKKSRARHAAFNRTFDELNSFSDRELADIGIHRTDIAGIARKFAFEG